MIREREVFRIGAAPALKQILDARGVSFGFVDVRTDMSVEELQTPAGVDAVLVSLEYGGCLSGVIV